MAVSPALLLMDRNLLARKQNARLDKQNDLGWKLFGKVPLRENAQKDSKKIQKEYEDKAGRPSKPPSPKQNVRKNLDFEPLSTTALILEDRPANLPAKPAEEAQKHRQQYEEMVVQAKKRELKEAQRRRRQLEERCRLEESIGNAVLTWNNEILPNWETMWCSRKVRDLWWQGIPPSVRGKVWSLAIGNELNITHELFDICLARAKERWRSFSAGGSEAENEDAGFSAADREASLELIKLDISRTFPNLCIFQQGGPYHDMLHSILGAYTCYRPDVGYVQGMSFIAAVLILNLDTADAFIAFSNLLNKPCQMAFFRVDHGLMLTYFAAFEVFFEENLPKLFAHFKKNNLTPDIYLIDCPVPDKAPRGPACRGGVCFHSNHSDAESKPEVGSGIDRTAERQSGHGERKPVSPTLRRPADSHSAPKQADLRVAPASFQEELLAPEARDRRRVQTPARPVCRGRGRRGQPAPLLSPNAALPSVTRMAGPVLRTSASLLTHPVYRQTVVRAEERAAQSSAQTALSAPTVCPVGLSLF
uniref:KIAA0232 n=1 Tax=Canis lupus familiaris TaxID=9615 RepID=A0A8C0RBP5_CANLF